MKKWAQVVTTLFPPLCAVCDRLALRRSPFCSLCEVGVEPLYDACPQCAMPNPHPTRMRRPIDYCRACRALPPHFDSAHAPYLYEGAVQRAVLRFKLGEQPALAAPLAAEMRAAIVSEYKPTDFDFVVPVPLHPHRLRTRGYNPAALLATNVALGRVTTSLLSRVIDTPCQGGLNRVERQRNVQHAFKVQRAIDDARVLIVDDVLTTGATANACAQELKAAGAKSVHVLTVARAVT